MTEPADRAKRPPRMSWPTLPRIEISTSSGIGRQIIIGAIVAAIWAASIFYARWDASADRDRHWRTEIASKSATVMQIMGTANDKLPAADAARVGELEAEKNALEAELARLRDERERAPLSAACNQCRIPARRLRF